MEIFPDMRTYFAYSANASLNLSYQIGNCQRCYGIAKFRFYPMIGARNAGSNHDQCLTCNVPMYNEREYFDNTSKPQQQHKPYRQEVNLRSSHTVGKGKEIPMPEWI